MTSLKRNYLVIIVALVLVCSISIGALAVDDINDLNAEFDKQQTSQSYSPGKIWVDFVKLIIVLGLIVLAAWSIIKLFSKQMTNKMQGTWIHVVDEVTIGQNRGIILCEVGEKLYAIGASDHNINLLFEIDNPKLLEEINYNQQTEAAPNATTWPDIKDLIKDKLKLGNSSSSPSKQEFRILMDEQFQRLEKLSDNTGRNETKEDVMK